MDQTASTNTVINVARHLQKMARDRPDKRAVVSPVGKDRAGRIAYAHLTFRQLDQAAETVAHGFERMGITRGMRTLLMVRPCIDFFAITFAFFKIGAVPVMVDPGMGIGRMLACLKESRPKAMVGIPAAHMLSRLCPKYFKSIKTRVTVGPRLFWGGASLSQILKMEYEPFQSAQTSAGDTAAILFTTGSTGPAKGVVYTHGVFDAQVRHIQSHFEIGADEIDLPTFPLFALFDPALGMTAVIPDMDPTRPAHVNPRKIIEAIKNQGVTNMFASPALLNRVGRYGKENGIRLPSLKRVVSAGAPVSPANIEQFACMLESSAEIHTPYGATEAVPIISIGSKEIISETKALSLKGFGMCVGRPLTGMSIRIIRISDTPIAEWSEELCVPDGEVGEIVVKGDLVTRQYFERPHDTKLAKIKEQTPEGTSIWHRMGDLGWRDGKERVWFCGRKSHRVITLEGNLFTIPCESIFNSHPQVSRSALVGVGDPPDQTPVICIEQEASSASKSKKQLKQELLEMARQNDLTSSIDTILFHRSFPVDIRHNAKIFREKLRIWAQKKI